MNSFRNGRPLKPWLVRILVNTVMGQRRRQSIPVAPLEDTAQLTDPDDPVELAEQGETQERVRLAISVLSEEHKQVIMLRYFTGLSVPELTRALGCRQGTVKSRLSRAIRRLRNELGEPSIEVG